MARTWKCFIKDLPSTKCKNNLVFPVFGLWQSLVGELWGMEQQDHARPGLTSIVDECSRRKVCSRLPAEFLSLINTGTGAKFVCCSNLQIPAGLWRIQFPSHLPWDLITVWESIKLRKLGNLLPRQATLIQSFQPSAELKEQQWVQKGQAVRPSKAVILVSQSNTHLQTTQQGTTAWIVTTELLWHTCNQSHQVRYESCHQSSYIEIN